MAAQLAEPTYIGDLGNGLVRRWSTPADQEKIGQLTGVVFREGADDPFDLSAADYIRILLDSTFPFMHATDFALVEDTGRPDRPVVACACLFRHEWRYAGIRFGVGRPEVVATDEQYRNRGLVRALFEMLHARSDAEGHLAQAITGIPYFYRQFGYEYTLDLGGFRATRVTAIPQRQGEDPEPYALRPATYADIPLLRTLYDQRLNTSLIWHEAPESMWRYYIACWDDPAVQDRDLREVGLFARLYMIDDIAGHAAGFVWTGAKRYGGNLSVSALEFLPHVNWQTAMPALLRALVETGRSLPSIGSTDDLGAIRFRLGRAHPAYAALGEALAQPGEPPYAWYLRIANTPKFIQHIAPVLEARLAGSILTGYTGDLKIDHYRGGLRLRFDQGKLTLVEPWRPPAYGDAADAGCPALTFLQLLTGYRSLAALREIFPDVWASDVAVLLINTLFPAQPSAVAPLA